MIDPPSTSAPAQVTRILGAVRAGEPERTIEREWRFAKAWLNGRLAEPDDGNRGGGDGA